MALPTRLRTAQRPQPPCCCPGRLQQQSSARRRSTRCSFSLVSLPTLLFGHSQPQQREQQQQDSLALYSMDGGFQEDPQPGGDLYRTLLQHAEEVTFNVSTWAAGSEEQEQRMLQEAEGMLQVCIQERPQHLQPRVLLLRNLMRQSQGREADVPALALQALREADLPSADPASSMMRHLQVLQVVMLGLKAVYKLKEEAESAPMPMQPPAHSVKSFLAAAEAAAPSFGPEFDSLALRVKRRLVCCSDETRAAMLADKGGYMSCVDLSAVVEQHVVVGAGGDVSGEAELTV